MFRWISYKLIGQTWHESFVHSNKKEPIGSFLLLFYINTARSFSIFRFSNIAVKSLSDNGRLK